MAAITALPPLRDDLSVLPGPPSHDGSPSWTLHDPQSNRYFRLSWPAFEILSRWHLGEAEQVLNSVYRETTLAPETADVAEMVEFLDRGGLLRVRGPRDVDRLLLRHDAGKTGLPSRLLHHYLFFRIPLVRPDSWLERAAPYVAWLGSRAFRWASLAALLIGLIQVMRRWDGFVATFVDHFSVAGLAAFGLALGFAKTAHELGHAFTAKHYGCRVPTMGVAFLVLWPMLYTDVTDSWRLVDRRKRLMVGGAGILAELTIAAWALPAWGLLPDGPAKGVAFTLAVTTLISSLAVNLSPFMRFDGYFLAMDALDRPNLHPRSFALARRHLREALFRLGEPEPEILPRPTRILMIAFAWVVWIYRLSLFLGIAVLVYHFFIKVVGVVLFAVEIGWFVIRPFWAEISEWKKRLPAIRAGRRFGRLGTLLAAGLLMVAVPWSGRVSAPAMLKADGRVVLYAPMPAVLTEVAAADGMAVEAGAVLARLDNPDARLRQEQTSRRIAVLKYEMASIGFEESFRARSQSIAEELEAALAEQAALTADLARLTLTAPISGTVADLSHDLQIGQWTNPHEPVLSLRRGARLEAFVAEADLPRIAAGDSADFIPEGRGAVVRAVVASIDRTAVKSLGEPALAVPFGGTIPARFFQKALVPDSAVYRILLTPAEPMEASVPLRGQALIDGERQSLLGHVFRTMAAVLIREWGI